MIDKAFFDDAEILFQQISENVASITLNSRTNWLGVCLRASEVADQTYARGAFDESAEWLHCVIFIYDKLAEHEQKGSKESLILSAVRERIKSINRFGKYYKYHKPYREFIVDWFIRIVNECDKEVGEINHLNLYSESPDILFSLRRLKNALKALEKLESIPDEIQSLFSCWKAEIDSLP